MEECAKEVASWPARKRTNMGLLDSERQSHKPQEYLQKLTPMARALHQNAIDHGWWEYHPEVPDQSIVFEKLLLINSEIAEVVEDIRKTKPYFNKSSELCTISAEGKPEGVAIELADVLIRTLDLMVFLGINPEEVVNLKHNYNKNRSYRHGGKSA